MSEQVIADEPYGSPSTAAGQSSLCANANTDLVARKFADGLGNIGPAITLAGAAYPVLLAFGYTIVAFVFLLTSQCTMGEFVERLIGALLGSFLLAGIGLIWATVVAFAVLPLIYLFVRSLALRGSIVRLGAFCSGLVGFVAIMPFFIGAMSGPPNTLAEIAIFVLLGPALTTVVGQLGGAWGAWRTRWYERAVARATVAAGDAPGELSAGSSKDSIATHHRRLQFGIRHLLVISVWISVLLAAIRISRLDYSFMLLLLGCWLIYQFTTLWVGRLLFGWIGRRKFGRQSRSA